MRHKHKHKKNGSVRFSYAYAYVAGVLTYLSGASAIASAYVLVKTRLNRLISALLSAGSEIALSWSPMRLKILHWRPEFHNWLPHFSIWRLKKCFHSPVGAYGKKLISDPGQCCFLGQESLFLPGPNCSKPYLANPWLTWTLNPV